MYRYGLEFRRRVSSAFHLRVRFPKQGFRSRSDYHGLGKFPPYRYLGLFGSYLVPIHPLIPEALHPGPSIPKLPGLITGKYKYRVYGSACPSMCLRILYVYECSFQIPTRAIRSYLVGVHAYAHTLHFIALHYITLHHCTLDYITIHYITLRYVTLHYVTLCYITLDRLRYITSHYIPVYIAYTHACLYV